MRGAVSHSAALPGVDLDLGLLRTGVLVQAGHPPPRFQGRQNGGREVPSGQNHQEAWVEAGKMISSIQSPPKP